MLAEFTSVVDAVRCAGEIQCAMADRDLDLSEGRRLRFRIGVNLGDVIADGGNIYGDGVNIAARLEGLPAPGGICVSGTVRDHIGDRLPYAFEDMGEQSVKNIARPVRAYAVRPEGTARLPTGNVSSAASSSPPVAAPRLSIVVLPFTNLSDDREQQYFADGISEDLTTDLSRLENMFVISSNTAFTYRNKPIDTKQIGRELGVCYVLEGSVRRSGNQLRVNTQMIDAANDAHLWAERFDRDTGDLFRGRAAGLKPYSGENQTEQIGLFEHPLAHDPESVGAQSRLAASLVGRVGSLMSDSAAVDLGRAEGLVARALAAKPRSAYAYFVKGNVLRMQKRWEDAILEHEMALAWIATWWEHYTSSAGARSLPGR